MGSYNKTATILPQSLSSALDQSKQVKHKVGECAQKISSVTAVLKKEVSAHLPLEIIESALNQSEEVEETVQECVDDLSSVNMALVREIAERKYLEDELFKSKIEERRTRHLAFHDAITGLPNRALFNDRLDNALAQAERHERGIALLFIDLDDFRIVNDCYGHTIGDEMLKMVAERLKASTRTEDTVGRHGGDKFLCLLLDVKDETYVARIAAKIARNISRPFVIGGLQLSVTPSVGISVYPADGDTADLMVNNADVAMYMAKQSNKAKHNTSEGCCFYSSLRN